MTAQVHASGLRRNPTWLRALTAFLVTRLGDLVFDLTVVLWITTDLARGESWAPAAVSGVLVAAVVPTLVFGPLAGVHADRHDRRRMMLRANLLQALFIGSLLVTPVLVGHVSDALVLVWVYVAVFVTNAAGQYFNQGRLALVAVSVPTEDRTAAFGMQGVAVNLLSIIGPPLAAPLLFSVGVYPALASTPCPSCSPPRSCRGSRGTTRGTRRRGRPARSGPSWPRAPRPCPRTGC